MELKYYALAFLFCMLVAAGFSKMIEDLSSNNKCIVEIITKPLSTMDTE